MHATHPQRDRVINTPTRRLAWFMLHATSSVSLVLLNKVMMTSSFHCCPFFIMLLQNSSTILLTFLATQLSLLSMRRVDMLDVARTAPSAVCYVLLLWTSLRALEYCSVALVVMTRNLVPLVTAVGEALFMRERFTAAAYGGLLLVFAGSTLFVPHDKSVHLGGFPYLMANLLLSGVSPLLDKRLAKQLVR